MYSKLVILALIALLISSIALASVQTAKAQTATMSLVSSFTEISTSDVGSPLQVNVTVANVVDLWQWALNMTWDPLILNLTQIREGPFLKGPSGSITTMFNVPLAKDIHDGILPEMVCTSTATDFSSVSGSGVLATLTFQILTAQTTQIVLGNTQLNKIDLNIANTVPIPHTSTDLEITVTQTTPTPTQTPTDNPNSSATETPSPSSTDTPTGSPTQSNNPTGNPSNTQLPTTTPETTENNPDLTTVYYILAAGAVMAVLVAVGVFLKRK